jgi:catechol 2,3-dioxygenase-like lactoylglutathione lyase family enzyme
MALEALNHYTIRPVDLERTKNFYVDVLGLPIGDRPPLGFPGYWLYCGAVPTVHLIGPRAEEAAHPARAAGATGLLDHIAFSCTGLSEIRARLHRHDIAYTERVIPRDGQTQLFMHDPDGVAVELNFPKGDV